MSQHSSSRHSLDSFQNKPSDEGDAASQSTSEDQGESIRSSYPSTQTDDSLRSDGTAHERPEEIALPESQTESVDDPEEESEAESSTTSYAAQVSRSGYLISGDDRSLGSSLDVILRATSRSPPQSSSEPGSSVDVQTPSSEGTRSPQTRSLQTYPSYKKVLERASTVLEHIKTGNMVKPSRVEKTTLTCYDYYDSDVSFAVKIEDPGSIFPLRHIPLDVRQRVLVAEDLSRDTIDALGKTFGVSPEFFEEHLLNSGYGGAQYEDPPARTWKTSGLTKSYVSIKWFRPVNRLPALFLNRADLLKGELEHMVRGSRISTRAETNIFRSEWGLWTDPRITAGVRRVCGLEERASIWRKDVDGDCQIVIVLLDPLPVISEEERWMVQVVRPKRAVDSTSHAYDGEDGEDDPEEASSAAGYDRTEGILGRLYEGDTMEDPQRVVESAQLWSGLRGKKPRTKWEEKKERRERVLIEHVAPRKAIAINIEEAVLSKTIMDTLEQELSETKTTRKEISNIVDDFARPVNPVMLVFTIIRQDTLTLLQLLRQILSDIDTDILDDTKMEDRLALWRQLISRGQRELPELKESLQGFLAFSDVVQPAASDTDSDIDMEQQFQTLSHEIDELLARLRTASASLTSNMGLLESRRSIEEAHAVTRLTELAFIFIPLSFATSVFGMQIKPFADPAPLWTFFVVATVVTTFAYMMRLTMRSQWLGRLKLSVKYDIRKYAEQHGLNTQVRSVPVLLLIRWLVSTISLRIKKTSSWIFESSRKTGTQLWAIIGFPISFILLIGIIATTPIAVLWTRDLEPSMQGSVTIAIILAVGTVVGVPYWRNSDPAFRNAFPNLVRRRLRSTRRSTVFISFWIVAMVVFVAIPLALIWTRPLAAGIKAGLTAGILIVVLIGMGVLLISKWIQRLDPRLR